MESSISIVSVLILAAFGLMVAVSGGVIYLTLAEWRDRRRQDEAKRAENPKRRR